MRNRPNPRRFRLGLEALEDRTAPANLQVVGYDFLDDNNSVIQAPAVGERVRIQIRWAESGLTPSNQYQVRLVSDGITLLSNTISGAGFPKNDNWVWYNWYVRPSTPLTFAVDAFGTVAETNEFDNTLVATPTPAAPDLPQRLIWPLTGRPFKDWSIATYNDVDPTDGGQRDYRGGPFTYDIASDGLPGHDGFDIALPNFAKMDAGVPVVAAADGTVIAVADGYFDRDTSFGGQPANFVSISHGNGWATVYYHLARDSTTVAVGDHVTAGQVLGLAGSSGVSTGPHLHFGVYHNGRPVESMYDPLGYYAEPLGYQGDQFPAITDGGLTNGDPSGEILSERPAVVADFPTSSAGDIWLWYALTHQTPSQTPRIRWYRPDGQLYTTYNSTGVVGGFGQYKWVLTWSSASAFPGTWAVAVDVNGTELLRRSFTVGVGSGKPSITVFDDANTRIIDGRITPIDFGILAQGSTPPQIQFAIGNQGDASLNVNSLRFPAGFALIGTFPSSVPAHQTRQFTLQMDTLTVGRKYGAVQFSSNSLGGFDTFTFLVEGQTTGTPAAGTPQLSSGGPSAVVFRAGVMTAYVAPRGVVSPNGASFAGGYLEASVIDPIGFGAEYTSVVDQGRAVGQIGLDGTAVLFGGVPIGTVTRGPPAWALFRVDFNAAATSAAVQALIRALTVQPNFFSQAPRHVVITVKTGSGVAADPLVITLLPIIAPEVAAFTGIAPIAATSNGLPTVTFTTVNLVPTISDPGIVDPITFDYRDLVLTRNGGPNLITSSVSIVQVAPYRFELRNGVPLTSQDGTYKLTVNTSGIRTATRNSSISPFTLLHAGGIPGGSPASITWVLDATPPRVSITPAAGQSNPTSAGPVRFRVSFSEPVFGFDAADVTIGGTAFPSGYTVTGSGSEYEIAVTGMTATGTVTVTVAAGAATDAANLPSLAASVPGSVAFIRPAAPPASAITPVVPSTVVPTVPSFLSPTVPPYLSPTVPPSVNRPRLVGQTQFAVGAGSSARIFNADRSLRYTIVPFPGFIGEVRTAAADFNGDGVADLVVGIGPGSPTHVRVFDGVTQSELFNVDPFEASFTGGVFVAAGDITGDGIADLVITPDEGGGPRVRIFSGAGFGLIADFFGIDDPTFRGGARAAVGDINGDGVADLIVAAGFGGGPRVAGFDGKSLNQGEKKKLFGDFLAFEEGLRNGIFVAAGDLDGDGKAELIAGGGPGGGPRVSSFAGSSLVSGSTPERVVDFFAGDPNNRGGVRVAVKNLDNDANADLVVGAGPGAAARVTTYAGKTLGANLTPPELFALDGLPGFSNGVFVG